MMRSERFDFNDDNQPGLSILNDYFLFFLSYIPIKLLLLMKYGVLYENYQITKT